MSQSGPRKHVFAIVCIDSAAPTPSLAIGGRVCGGLRVVMVGAKGAGGKATMTPERAVRSAVRVRSVVRVRRARMIVLTLVGPVHSPQCSGRTRAARAARVYAHTAHCMTGGVHEGEL